MEFNSKATLLVRWTLRIVPALILLQTLYFKFTAHPESVELFTKLHAEPYGRIGTGVLELIASILLLIPSYTRYGALLAVGLMFGAIGSHLFVIGIESNGDGGFLFILALVVMITALLNLLIEKGPIIADLKKFSLLK